METTKVLRLILGDQLNKQHSWFNEVDNTTCYLLMEVRSETDYVRHHNRKIVALFAAMRRFAAALVSKGHRVIYLRLTYPENAATITQNCQRIVAFLRPEIVEYQLPDEWRLEEELKQLEYQLAIPVKSYDTEHFLASRETLATFFGHNKQPVMEPFYRFLRTQYRLLLNDDGSPIGGKWNYDTENRNRMPEQHIPPLATVFDNPVEELSEMIRQSNVETIGLPFTHTADWPLDSEQAIEQLRFFVEHQLTLFGTFQDAMSPHSDFLYHSRLSFALNCKLISPLEVVQEAIRFASVNPEKVTLNQLEGFVRQIVGWREYMRGIYWSKMPHYKQLNYFNHTRQLPGWFWTGKTKMHCLQHAIGQSLRLGYAHHIQRLMVIGNFALLAGIHPDEVDAWYLGVYVDAFEWVQITNTRGMSQYADGGIVGTKPYVSSGAYIHKMGHYCGSCYYNYKDKTGTKSCPFNSLYWHFFDRHASKLKQNPRIGMAVSTWGKMTPQNQTAILERANEVLNHIEVL